MIVGLLTALLTPSKVKEGEEYDGVEKKCYGDIPLPFKIGNEQFNYPKLCAGDSIKEDKNECPYGCYYVGTGQVILIMVSNVKIIEVCYHLVE